MPDLSKILLSGETLSFRTKKSFIIFFMPLVWTALTLLFFYRNTLFISDIPGLPLVNSFADLAWIPGLAALYSWSKQGMLYLTSDFIVTSQRVIMREGFFFKHATETRLAAVAEIKIDQSLLGQLLNYGSIRVNSFGGGSDVFEDLRSPYEFQKAVSEVSKTTSRA